MKTKVEGIVGDGKMRMNLEVDRLSSLPDDLIHKILSFIDIREAIGTSVLSSRWRFIWKSMPYLNLSIHHFITLPKFSKFVTNVLSRRNKLTEVYSMKLNLRVKANFVLVKKILSYALSHNIQELNVVCFIEKDIEFPLSIFSSQSLKLFNLTTNMLYRSSYSTCFPSTWELPSLTTLDLHDVILRDNNAKENICMFSKCANLKNLTLNEFKIYGSDEVSIFHPQLLNLTLKNCVFSEAIVNVVAPQLENLTIRSNNAMDARYIVSAPRLISLVYKSTIRFRLATKGFHSLEKAEISVSWPEDEDAHQIICMLQQLYSVKFLKLNMEITEVLSSSSVDLILDQPSPFVNLKSLKVYPERECQGKRAPKKVTMSTKLKSFLLDSSPGSTFTMVSREEVEAQKLMDEVRVLLEKTNGKSKTNRAQLEQGKTIVGSHEHKKLKIGEKMVDIMSGCENTGLQLSQRIENTRRVLSKLQRMTVLLTKLPASKSAKFQTCISSLYAEVGDILNHLKDCLNFQEQS